MMVASCNCRAIVGLYTGGGAGNTARMWWICRAAAAPRHSEPNVAKGFATWAAAAVCVCAVCVCVCVVYWGVLCTCVYVLCVLCVYVWVYVCVCVCVMCVLCVLCVCMYVC